jgi:hypothetical protein
MVWEESGRYIYRMVEIPAGFAGALNRAPSILGRSNPAALVVLLIKSAQHAFITVL